MANTKSAEKRMRQSEIKRARNKAARSTMRTVVKKVKNAVESGDTKTAESLLGDAISVIDRTAKKGVVHKNTAARTKSRLVAAVRRSEKAAE